jgi:hypothetical protein
LLTSYFICINSWLIPARQRFHALDKAYNVEDFRGDWISKDCYQKSASWGDQSMDNPQRWVFARMALGVLQMTGAVSSIGLIIYSGVNALSLTCVVVTSLLTTVSVVLFGSRPEMKN